MPSQPDVVGTVHLPPVTESFPPASNSRSIPLHNPQATNVQAAFSPGLSGVLAQGLNQLQPTPPNSQNQPALLRRQLGSRTQNSSLQMNGQFIYWCIDVSDTHAQLVELDARRLTDHNFVTKLLGEYATVTGWWYRFWTMSSCCGARFKKFRYLYDN